MSRRCLTGSYHSSSLLSLQTPSQPPFESLIGILWTTSARIQKGFNGRPTCLSHFWLTSSSSTLEMVVAASIRQDWLQNTSLQALFQKDVQLRRDRLTSWTIQSVFGRTLATRGDGTSTNPSWKPRRCYTDVTCSQSRQQKRNKTRPKFEASFALSHSSYLLYVCFDCD